MTGEDWYIASIDSVESSAADLHDAIDRTVEHVRHARRERLGGVGLVDIVKELVRRGGRDARLAPTVAFRAFERALRSHRAAVVRALVDEEHMTFSQIGELTGVSRQMVARLYRSADSSDPVIDREESG